MTVWWLRPRWRRRSSVSDMRAQTTTGHPSAAAAWALSSADIPPCPSADAEPRIPGPGPHTTASQPRSARPWWIAPAVVIASSSPPNAGPAVMWPASRPRARRSRTTREWPPGSAPPAVWT